MSAFDITGAIVWGLLTGLFAFGGWDAQRSGGSDDTVGSLAAATILFLALFIFCLARLFGASL